MQLLINGESMGCRDDGVLGRGAETLHRFTPSKLTLLVRTYRHLFPPISLQRLQLIRNQIQRTRVRRYFDVERIAAQGGDD